MSIKQLVRLHQAAVYAGVKIPTNEMPVNLANNKFKFSDGAIITHTPRNEYESGSIEIEKDGAHALHTVPSIDSAHDYKSDRWITYTVPGSTEEYGAGGNQHSNAEDGSVVHPNDHSLAKYNEVFGRYHTLNTPERVDTSEPVISHAIAHGYPHREGDIYHKYGDGSVLATNGNDVVAKIGKRDASYRPEGSDYWLQTSSVNTPIFSEHRDKPKDYLHFHRD